MRLERLSSFFPLFFMKEKEGFREMVDTEARTLGFKAITQRN